MSILSLLILSVCAVVAIDIQVTTTAILAEQQRVRAAMMASQDRCPAPAISQHCAWRVAARNHGAWEDCDRDHPPSGADLPMHRWFRLTGDCTLSNLHLPRVHGLRLRTMPMKIFR